VICVLGDAHLDVVVIFRGPVTPDSDTPATTSVGIGGQAANVAAWVAELGGSARLIAARADDMAGQLIAAELRRREVELAGPVLGGRTGVVVSLSEGGGRRSMLTDRGVGPLLSEAVLRPEWLDGCTALHLPGYSLVAEPVRGAALAAAGLAAARGVPVSVDLSSTSALRAFGTDRFRALIGRLRPATVLGNEEEAALIGDLPGPDLVVKLGARGVRAGGTVYPAHPAAPVDATGAGDAFAAGFLLGGISLGLEAAARAVSRMGAVP
jgi:ribokinase